MSGPVMGGAVMGGPVSGGRHERHRGRAAL